MLTFQCKYTADEYKHVEQIVLSVTCVFLKINSVRNETIFSVNYLHTSANLPIQIYRCSDVTAVGIK